MFNNRGNSLVLTRAFFVNNEIYIAFLLNSQALGVSGKNEQSPWRGAPEAWGPMQLHHCIGLRPALSEQHFNEYSEFLTIRSTKVNKTIENRHMQSTYEIV